MSESEETLDVPFRPGLEKVPVAVSKVCFLDGDNGILEYRGYRIEDLSRHSTFEEVAYLLLFGRLPGGPELERFRRDLIAHRRVDPGILEMLKCLPPGGHPMHALAAAVSAIGMFYRGEYHDLLDPAAHDERTTACVRLVAKLPTVLAAWHRLRSGKTPIPPRDDLGHAANFLHMLHGEGEEEGTRPAAAPDETVARVFDVCMILHAEHELNASTFAARVTGSTLADPHSVVAAALGALHGPLHGGANERVLTMLAEIGKPEHVESWVEDRLEKKQLIWAFGHREYRVKDPRATILQEQNESLFRKLGRTPLYDVALRLEQSLSTHPRFGAAPTLREKKFPNVDFYSGIAYEKMGIATDLFTPVFAISRVAGWLAHYLEQVETKGNKIFRPKQIYGGERMLTYPRRGPAV